MPATATTTARNWNLIWSRIVSWMFILGTAFFSASHIYSQARNGGLSIVEASAAIPFIDGFGVLGRILRSLHSRKAHRWGLVFMLVAGGVSLTVNFMQGHTPMQKAFGIITVIGFVAAEFAAGLVKEAVAEQQEETTTAVQYTQDDLDAAVAAERVRAMAELSTATAAAYAQGQAEGLVQGRVEGQGAAAAEYQRIERARIRREKAAAKKASEQVADSVPVSPAGPVDGTVFVPSAAELREAIGSMRWAATAR